MDTSLKNNEYIKIPTGDLYEIFQQLSPEEREKFDDIDKVLEEYERVKILRDHSGKIYQGKDGRWYTYVYDDHKNSRRKLVKPTKEKLEEELIVFYRENIIKGSMTVSDLYPKWIEYKSLHTNAKNTIMRINCSWKKYYIGTEIIDRPINKLTKLMLDEWAHNIIKQYDMTKKEYYMCTIIMRQVLEYAVDLGMIEESPMAKVRVNGRRMFRNEIKKKDSSQVYSREELKKIREFAWNDFNNRIKRYELAPLALLFQFETGVRIGELCVLCDDDVNGDLLHVSKMYRRDTKEIIDHPKGAFGERDVRLTSEAKRLIDMAKEHRKKCGSNENGYIFSMNENPLSYHSIASLYRKYCRFMGIPTKSSHKSRKTYISALIDGNVNINTIREMVGHVDERTTLNNYCFDRDTEDEKLKKIEEALR